MWIPTETAFVNPDNVDPVSVCGLNLTQVADCDEKYFMDPEVLERWGDDALYEVGHQFLVTQDPLLLPPAGRDPHGPQPARPLPGLRVREGRAGGQAGAAQPRHEGGHQDQDILPGEHRH